jgi:hypothetical protein
VEVIAALIVLVGTLAVLGAAAASFGVDSRPGPGHHA